MHITARERVLLTLLVHASLGVSQVQLAEAASVSVRTIQRDLKGLARTASRFGLDLVRNKDQTVFLQGNKEELLAHLQSMLSTEFTSDERQGVLLVRLLNANEPVKLFALASEMSVTPATVSTDLDKTSIWLETYGLELIRKRGYGIEIQGSETNKRRAMSGILSSQLTEEALYEAVHDQEMQHKVTERLLNVVDISMIKDVLRTVQHVKEAYFPHMADQSLIALVVHTTLAIERLRQGEQIRMDRDQLEALWQTEEHELASKLGRALEEAFDMTLPDEEIGYLVMHLRGARISGSSDLPFEEMNAELIGRIKQLIRGMEEELNVQFYEPSLIQDLLAHLKPALYRIRQQMKITNPLLHRLKEQYEQLFTVTKRQAELAFSPLLIPDEEIGFLVLHFGSILERRKRSVELRALVICPSGIGSAKMLASRIEQEFPEVSSITNASMFDLDSYATDAYDLVISTVKLEQERKAFHVSPVLTDDEVSEIRRFIDSFQMKRSPGTQEIPMHRRGGLARSAFVDIAKLSLMIKEFLQSVSSLRSLDLWAGIEGSLTPLEQEGYVTRVEDVLVDLRKREDIGGLGIPGTRLALYHARSEAVVTPFFRMVDLAEETKLMSMADEEQMVERIIVMVAPAQMERFELAFISYVSTLFIGSKEQVAVFQTGDDREVRQMLEEECRDYLVTFIQKGEEPS